MIKRLGVLAVGRVDVHAGQGETDVVLGAGIEGPLVHHTCLNIVVDGIGLLVVQRGVGEYAQPSRVV
ncbi:hypothetical protein D3C79_867110 [compost metagenome]